MKRTRRSVLACCALIMLFMASCTKDKIKDTSPATPPVNKPTTPDTVANLPAPVDTRFKVVGYLPDWDGDVNQVQYKKLTHVYYAFLIPAATGGYESRGDDSRLKSMVTNAHASGNNTKAIISVGGGGGGDAFASIVASATLRTAFINSMISFTDKYNLDGVDIDWEYPNPGTQASDFLTMMQQLSTALHNKGRILSIAVVGEGWDNSILNGIFDAVDIMNIMAYDDNNFQHSTFELGVESLDYWLNRGVPVSKAVLGVPFYGHDSSKDPNADDDQVNYNTILSDGGNASLDVYKTFGYNGLITMKSKTSFAMSNANGMCIWELGGDTQDNNSLLSAINSTIVAGGKINTGAPIGQIITLKGSNGAYVSGEGGTQSMTCTKTTAGDSEKFMVVDAGAGLVELRSVDAGEYMSSENGTKAINCNRTTPGTWEMFNWIANNDGTISLRSTNASSYRARAVHRI